jgi:hypothetical protein
MPTPAIYRSFSESLSALMREKRKGMLVDFALLVSLPFLLDKTVPQLGEIPGKFLFVLLIVYFGALVPYLVFRNALVEASDIRTVKWPWVRAALCNLWITCCIWFIYAALFHQ